MLDWLKGILGDAYTEEIDKKISDEVGKNFAAKADFNARTEEWKAATAALKQRDEQLEGLKKASGDVEAMKAQITELQATNEASDKAHKAEMSQLRRGYAADIAISGAKAKKLETVRPLLAEFLTKAEMDENGIIKGLDAEIKKLMSDESTSFLFEAAEDKPAPAFKGVTPGSGRDGTPETDPFLMGFDD